MAEINEVRAEDFSENERVNALASPYLEEDEHILWFGGKDEWRSRSSAEKRTVFFNVLKILWELLIVLMIVLIFLVTVFFAIVAVILLVAYVIERINTALNKKSGLYIVTNKSIMIMNRKNTMKIPYSRVTSVIPEQLGKKAGRLTVLYADRNIIGDLAAKKPYKYVILNKIEAPENVSRIILEAMNRYSNAEKVQHR